MTVFKNILIWTSPVPMIFIFLIKINSRDSGHSGGLAYVLPVLYSLLHGSIAVILMIVLHNKNINFKRLLWVTMAAYEWVYMAGITYAIILGIYDIIKSIGLSLWEWLSIYFKWDTSIWILIPLVLSHKR